MINGKYPRHVSELADLEKAVEEFVLPGFLPANPPITADTIVRTQGSCFATHVYNALNAAGVKARHINFTEAVNSPLANRHLFEYVNDEGKPYIHPAHEQVFSREYLAELRDHVQEEGLFIFTLGLAMCWFDKASKLPVINPDPRNLENMEWRLIDAAENEAALAFIVNALRQLNPSIKIVLTVSPVPLNRSPGYASTVAADCISKSTLRVAVHNYLAKQPEGVFYWPSFEIVRWLGAHLPPVFGEDDELLRHVNQSMVNLIAKLFLKHFVAPLPKS
jgi:hypothetical protein